MDTDHCAHIVTYYRWRYEIAGRPVPTRVLHGFAWYSAALVMKGV